MLSGMEDCKKVNYHRVGVGVFPPGKCLNLDTLGYSLQENV